MTTWTPRRAVQRNAFSLIELLVSITIMMVLISIFLPVVSSIHRMALALACPIVYVADDGGVWVCDAEGKRHLQVSDIPVRDFRLSWSPNGDRFAFQTIDGTAIIHPLSGKIDIVPECNAPTWVDENTIIGTRSFGWYAELWRTNVNSGKAALWIPLKENNLPFGVLTAQHQPYLTPGFVVCEEDWIWAPTFDVVLRDQEWNLKKVIWRDANNDVIDTNAKVDYTGEWVAWSRGKFPGAPPNLPFCVAMKALDAPSNEPPALLSVAGYDSTSFCDWTPEGFLLVIIRQNNIKQLAIIKKDGTLVRTIPTEGNLCSWFDCAAWRRYEHW